MAADIESKLESLQNKTYNEMLYSLKNFGMCNVIRPTGFGKTRLFMSFAARNHSKKFLYVHDVNSIKGNIIQKYRPTNVEFITYAAISRERNHAGLRAYLTDNGWDCIIFDESHLMGGENITKFLDRLIPVLVKKGTKILGGTATPLRTDGVNVTERFFNNKTVSSYSLADAIDDGIISEPLWTVAVAQKELMEGLMVKLPKCRYTVQVINQLDRAYAQLDGIEACYRDAVKSTFGGKLPHYMQFIAFYPTIKSLNENMRRLAGQIAGAFPGYEIHTYAMSSDPEHFSDITEIEESIDQRKKRVDLIFAVNMMNQGYHSKRLTGVIMHRATLSNVILTQQVGRCLSVEQKQRAIVFDNVGNAFLTPGEALQGLKAQGKTGMPSNVIGGVHEERQHRNIKLQCSPRVLEFLEWYERVRSVSAITDEQVEYAKRCRSDFHMTWDAIERYIGVPRWMVEGEMPK